MEPSFVHRKTRILVIILSTLILFVAAATGVRLARAQSNPTPSSSLTDSELVAQFRRVEVVGGDMLPGGMQELISGIPAGQQVVANALEFQNTVQQ